MKKFSLVMTFTVTLALLGLGTWYLVKSPATYSGTPESIAVAVMSDESSALISIAEDRGFFVGNGLYVRMRYYGNGTAAIKGMKSGEANISLSAEFPIVAETFKKEKISVIGCIDKYMPGYVIAKKDRGIKSIPDLKGKRIGVFSGSAGEFYLGRFLDLHGMSIKDVALAEIGPSQSPLEMIENGVVDGISSRKIIVDSIMKGLGDNGIVWPAQSDQLTHMVLACRNDWMASRPETIRRFLKSLVRAEEYLANHPDEAKAIIQKRLNFDESYLASIWTQHQFSLSLDQAMITAMKDEANWMIRNNLTPEKELPDFLNFIYVDGLKAIRPKAVSIIR
jgi:ABC-type nitrate/sulfonate/bicarbonate transport system substrate-binding protein